MPVYMLTKHRRNAGSQRNCHRDASADASTPKKPA
jgi:hypothetical protein